MKCKCGNEFSFLNGWHCPSCGADNKPAAEQPVQETLQPRYSWTPDESHNPDWALIYQGDEGSPIAHTYQAELAARICDALNAAPSLRVEPQPPTPDKEILSEIAHYWAELQRARLAHPKDKHEEVIAQVNLNHVVTRYVLKFYPENGEGMPEVAQPVQRIEELEREKSQLLDALQTVKKALRSEAERDAIKDTLWVDETCTVVDCIDLALNGEWRATSVPPVSAVEDPK